MLNIGRKQKLVVVKKVEFGIYLGETREAGEKERVLLPIKQVPEGTKEGDELEVFLYRDSSDRLIATTREPKLVLGELAVLNVAATGKIGAFLDWGLEKDLLLPYKEQTVKVKKGQTLSSISKAYLGPGMECYVEALNGVKEVKEGQSLKIPKLEWKKKK